MTLEFRVQHDVATDASPVPSTSDRTGLRRLLDRLAARRAAAQVRRTQARLAELTDLQRLLTGAREVIERGWIQHAWFAYLDEHGRTRKASSAAAMDVQGRPLVGACLVGSIVSAAGGRTPCTRNPCSVRSTWSGTRSRRTRGSRCSGARHPTSGWAGSAT